MAITRKTEGHAAGADAAIGSARDPASRLRRACRSPYVGLLGAAILIAIMSRPMVIGRTFVGWDWYPHEWFIWHQAETLKATGLPTLFSHNDLSVFTPHFAFYGGTLYAIAGALTIVTGDPNSAMIILTVAAFSACYGGWYWLARQCGLGMWSAHAPAALFITAPYYLAMTYANGSLHELVATSAVPPLIASALAILRADRLRAGPAAVLAISATLFTGSHNLALLLGTTALVGMGALLFAVTPQLRRLITRAGALRVVGLVIPAVLVNGWFLLPDLAYQAHTIIASSEYLTTGDLPWGMKLVQPSDLFSLGRKNALFDYQHMALQLPVLGVAWILLTLVLTRSAWRSSWYRAVVILLAVMTALVVVMMSLSLVRGLPWPYTALQFSYRLETYILLGFTAAVIGGLLLLSGSGPRRRLWAWVLVPVLVWSIGGAIGQLEQRPPTDLPEIKERVPYRSEITVPGTYDYATDDLPLIPYDPRVELVRFPFDGERGEPAKVTVKASRGMYMQTNILTMPQLVHLDGARFVGRGEAGQAVLEVTKEARPGVAVITLSAARPWPVVVGWIASLVGIAGLALNGVAIALAAWRRRRSGEAAGVVEP